MTNGYDFYFDTPYGLVTFPIAPGKLTIKVGSKNKVVTLINEGDINIMKSPALTEVEFEARFPMRSYPYAKEYQKFKKYFDVFKKLKEKKKSFRFIVARKTPKGKATWDTNILVALEKMDLVESADEGDDVLVTFTLKQYKEYSAKKVNLKLPTKSEEKTETKKETTSTSNTTRETKKDTDQSKTHTVKSGDNLWSIAKKYYGKATDSRVKKIYNKNKTVIEKAAKKNGKKDSNNGWWIYPGTKLIIPEL